MSLFGFDKKGWARGFSFPEILIILGVLSVIFTTTVFYLNPASVLKQSRDSQRLSDLNLLFLLINDFSEKFASKSLGNENTVYLSLPDESSSCSSYVLPSLPDGWSYLCANKENYQNIDSTGWLPIDFSLLLRGLPFSLLPRDPKNNNNYYYAFVASDRQFVLSSLLESEKYLGQYAARDGGIDDARFELGNNFFLWANPLGLVGYWGFDQIVAGLTQDSSGYGNSGSVSGAVISSGKNNQALSFDGSDDYVQIDSLSVNTQSGGYNSVELWMYWYGVSDQIPFGWNAPYSLSFDHSCLGFNVGQGNLLGVSDNNLARNWIHVVAVFYNGVPAYDNSKLYLNGEKQSLQNCHGSVTPAKNATQTVFVGSWGSGGQNYFNGLIDGFKIYNRVLTEAEIQALFQATK
jgi:hypothetical protein